MAAIEAALRDDKPAELEWQQLPAVQPLMVMLGYKLGAWSTRPKASR